MKRSHEIDMTQGPIFSKIVVFALPLMLTGILQLLFNAADVIVVGKFAGSRSLAAVGSNGALINLLVNVFVLWQLRFSLRNLVVAYLLSIPATLVAWSGLAIGFSSVLYALMGMQMAGTRMSKAGWAVFVAANGATAFVPGIAFGVHCTAFALGWIFVKVKRLSDEYRGACKRR